ncbi:hypothetical protein BB560_001360 [Smittium megazygosporum]|uniref:Uncharacterized protein n=1 Tax=Smittium megazygosporum TaxID=133381 RepID=A0A2T9ZHQ9_9FUNG|nr:hypothetical protein BB560_001360 [Smittium megazygosporum]
MSLYVTARLKQGGVFVAGEEIECLLIFSNRPKPKNQHESGNLPRSADEDLDFVVNSSESSIASPVTSRTRSRGFTNSGSPNSPLKNQFSSLQNPNFGGANRGRNSISLSTSNSINPKKEYRSLGLVQIFGKAYLKSKHIKENLFESIKLEEQAASRFHTQDEHGSERFNEKNNKNYSSETKGSSSSTNSFWFWKIGRTSESSATSNTPSRGIGGGFSGKLSTTVDRNLLGNSDSIAALSIFETQTEIIFSELSLSENETKSFLIKSKLDKSLPPSFDGTTITIQYELVVFIKRQMLDTYSYILRVPFYIISPNFVEDENSKKSSLTSFDNKGVTSYDLSRVPKVKDSYINPINIALDLTSHHLYLNDCQSKLDFVQKFIQYNGETTNKTINDFNNDFQNALAKSQQIKNIFKSCKPLIPPSGQQLEVSLESEKMQTTGTSSFNMKENPKLQLIQKVISSTRRPSRNSYSLNVDGTTVAVVNMHKENYQLGDFVTGEVVLGVPLDGRNTTVHCYKLSIWLESYEDIDPQYLKTSPEHIQEISCLVHSELHTVCRGYSVVGFSLSSVANEKGISTRENISQHLPEIIVKKDAFKKGMSLIKGKRSHSGFFNRFISLRWRLRIQVQVVEQNTIKYRDSNGDINDISVPHDRRTYEKDPKNDHGTSEFLSSLFSEMIAIHPENHYDLSEYSLGETSGNSVKVDKAVYQRELEVIKNTPELVFTSAAGYSVNTESSQRNLTANQSNSPQTIKKKELIDGKVSPKITGDYSNSNCLNHSYSSGKVINDSTEEMENDQGIDILIESTVKEDIQDTNTSAENEIVQSTKISNLHTKKFDLEKSNDKVREVLKVSNSLDTNKKSNKEPRNNLRNTPETLKSPALNSLKTLLSQASSSEKHDSNLVNDSKRSKEGMVLTFESRYDNLESKTLECQIPIYVLPSVGSLLGIAGRRQLLSEADNNIDKNGNRANVFLESLGSKPDSDTRNVSIQAGPSDDDSFLEKFL